MGKPTTLAGSASGTLGDAGRGLWGLLRRGADAAEHPLELPSPPLESMVCECPLLLDQFSDHGVQIARRQMQVSLRLTSVANDDGTSLPRDLQHRRVFAQGMDVHLVHSGIARMHGGAFKQPGPIAASTGVLEDRHSKLGCLVASYRRAVGEVRNGSETQLAVDDTEYRISVEVQTANVTFQVCVGGGIAESQVSILRLQFAKVTEDQGSMSLSQGPDRYPRP